MILDRLALVVFWLCAAAMVHTYLLYPVTLRLLRRRPVRNFLMSEEDWPRVALLIPAYNEERVIGDKIKNSLALDYPADKLEILIGSDGSTDRTNEIVREFSDGRVKLFVLEGRNGKPAVLNRLVAETSAEVLIMTDANVRIEPGTFRNLVRHFADPEVAGVIARKEVAERGAASGERMYARHASRLKEVEAAVGGYSGAYGAYYAMRRCYYRPLPMTAMNDDILALYPAVVAGKHVAFEPSAVGYEEAAARPALEFRRRTRTGASNFMTAKLCPRLMRLSGGVPAYTFFSHKVLRWYFPFWMIGLLAANLVLLHIPFYRAILVVQLGGYALALLGFAGSRFGVRIPLLYQLYYFVAMNLALFIGWFAFKFRTRGAVWEPVAR